MNRLLSQPLPKNWIIADLPGAWYGIYHRALGMILLLAFVPLLPHALQLFGTSGLFDTKLLRLHPHGAGLSIYDVTIGMERYTGLATEATVNILVIGYLSACIMMIVGWHVRWAAAALLLLHYLFFMAVPIYNYGFDFLSLSALFYCAAYHPRWATPTLRLVQLHLCVIYLFSGLNKVVGSTWRNGEALWKAVQQPIGEPLIHGMELPPLPWLWTTLGLGVVFLELSYSVLIWWRATRPWMLCTIVLMHTGIALLLGLYAFSALMLLLNFTAFYYPYLKDSPCRLSGMPRQATVYTDTQAPNGMDTPVSNTSSIIAGVPPEKPP